MNSAYILYHYNNSLARERDLPMFSESSGELFTAKREMFDAVGVFSPVVTDADPLETIYHITQNLTYNWVQKIANDTQSIALSDEPLRSTSVGDVVVEVQTGNIFVVAMFGFKQIN